MVIPEEDEVRRNAPYGLYIIFTVTKNNVRLRETTFDGIHTLLLRLLGSVALDAFHGLIASNHDVQISAL